MRTSILYEFDGFLSSPIRARNKRNKISKKWQNPSAASSSFADPEGAGAGGSDLPGKLHKYRVPLQYWSGSPEKSQLPIERSMLGHHLSGVSLADR